MGYIYLLCVALLFSFGGTCVKLISPYFDAGYITFFRFAVGVLFLLLLKAMKRQPFQQHFGQVLKHSAGWILFGAVSKWLAYLTENYAIAHGTSYGNIVTQPAQTVFLTLASVLLFKEKLTFSKVLCILMCMGGVLCISWNGRPLDVFLGENIFLTILFWISGTLAGCPLSKDDRGPHGCHRQQSFYLCPFGPLFRFRSHSFGSQCGFIWHHTGSGLHLRHPSLWLHHRHRVLSECQGHSPGALLYGAHHSEHHGHLLHHLGNSIFP